MAKKNIDLNLSKKDIEEKEFSIVLKGYKPEDVDIFLDKISSDYTNMESIVNSFKEQLNVLKEEVQSLKSENKTLKTSYDTLFEQNMKIRQSVSNNPEFIKAMNKSSQQLSFEELIQNGKK